MRVVEPDLVSYSTIIKGFCKIGDLEQGLQLFSQMTRRGTKPDAISFRWPRSQFDVGCILSRIGAPDDKFEHGRFLFTIIPRKSTVAAPKLGLGSGISFTHRSPNGICARRSVDPEHL